MDDNNLTPSFEDSQSYLNQDLIGRYDSHTSVVADISGGAIASVADFGASVFNSVTFGKYDIKTEDLLRHVSDNALRVYEEHPDAVHAASFIGGMFVPAGLALKGMGAMRAGAKGMSWFSTERRAADLAKLEELMQAGPRATAEYKALKNAVFAKGLGNQVADAAATELAVLATMNAHPFMEDYVQDPIKNFGISMALGGVIGGAIGHIADRYAVAGIEGAVQSAAHKEVTFGYKNIEVGLNLATAVQTRQANIKNLTSMLEGAAGEQGPVKLSGIARDYAEQRLLIEKTMQKEEANTLMAKVIKATPGMADYHEALKLFIAENTAFQGMDSIAPLKVNEKLSPLGKHEVVLDKEFGEFTKKVKHTDIDGNIVEQDAAVTRAYYPGLGFAKPSDVSILGKAGSLKGVSEASILASKDTQKTAIFAVNTDASLDIAMRSAPVVDKSYLEALSYVDKLTPGQLARAAIDPDDLPMISALVSRANKEKESGLLNGLKIKLTKNEPSYDQQLVERIFKQEGVGADHHIKMAEFTNPKAIRQFDLMTAPDVSQAARDLLAGWLNGPGIAKMRSAADAFHFKGYGGNVPEANAYGELYNSARSIAIRDKFLQLADSDGNVYLWRGMKQNPTGHAALQSYTTDIEKAKEFGAPKLFKVRVDEIVGGFPDIPSRDGVRYNEIIVRAPRRDVEPLLPIGMKGEMVRASTVAMKKGAVQEVTMQELSAHLLERKEQLVKDFLAQGKELREMSTRSNIPEATLSKWIGENGAAGASSLAEHGPVIEYSSMANLSEYLNPAKNPLVLRTNIRKMPWAQMSAAIDTTTFNRMSHDITEGFMRQASDVTMIRDFTSFMYTEEMNDIKDIMRSQITNAVNGKAGNRFLSSLDQYGRNMGDFSAVATHIGKEVQGLANRTMTRMLEPMTLHMERIAKDEVQLLELNTAIKFNAELSKYRIYKDRQFWIKEEQIVNDVKKEVLVPALFQGQEFKIVSDSVDSVLTRLHQVGEELYGVRNTLNKIQGKPNMHNIGTWIPAFNPRDKHIAYVWNKADDTTQLLWGNTAAELQQAVEEFKPTVSSLLQDGTVEIVYKSEQAAMNLLNARLDPLSMKVANIEKFHSGASTSMIVKSNADILGAIVGGIEHTVQSNARHMAEISLFDVSDSLQKMSTMNQRLTASQPLGVIAKALSKEKDAAQVMRNALLGLSDLPDYTSWLGANQSFEAVTGYVLGKVGNIFKEVYKPAKGFFAALKKDAPTIDYKAFSEKLAEAGVHNPYKVFGEQAEKLWQIGKLTESKNVTPRLIYASNALAATAALRFAETAQPLVNAMSLPILTASAIAEKLPANFLGAKLGTGKVMLAEAMHDGIRAMNSPKFEHLGEMWAKRGYFDSIVSEASKVLKLPREFDQGIIATTEKLIDSKVVTMMSKGADYSESLVRKVSMYTGAMIAKRMYPELGDEGITIFARQFMDKTIGNYHSSQRPVFFQGTLGTAMGLFQTYMLTYAQSMYRHLELKDYKGLGKMMLAQTTIFGAGSLPGFKPISELIGEHYSDDHTDLQTGLLRSVSDPIARATLYGLPSSLGPAFYTRGEMSPRIATPANLTMLPTVQMMGQAVEGVGRVVSAVGSQDEPVGRALTQALSLQSISRPLARGAEAISGYSITAQGNTVQSPNEVWTATGLISRALSVRPTEEAMLREANHLNTLYGSLDREQRSKATAKLKTAIRSDALDAETMERIAGDYMHNGGTATGWRSAVRTATVQAQQSMVGPLKGKMKPENALNHMMDMIDE